MRYLGKYIITVLGFLSVLSGGVLNAQSLQHPVIYTTQGEKQAVLALIDQHDWAKGMEEELHAHVDSIADRHRTNPELIVNAIPAFAKNDHENKEREAGPVAAGHNRFLTLASNAGILYHLTDDQKYAQLSADILGVYIDHIAPRTPETTTICGFAFFDPRTTYAPFAVAYDFIYNFLQKPQTQFYSKAYRKRVAFDNAKAQKAISNMVGNVLQEYGEPDVHGKIISNHPILTAPGALFGIFCIDDDVERERLFNVFWEKGTAHQNSFKHTILPMFTEQGIWPESLGYSFMPIITMVLNMVDRIKPDMNVGLDNQHIFEGNFLFDYMRNPDRTFVRYGDSKRYKDGTGNLYRYTLSLADRRGFTALKEKAQVALRQSYEAEGGYTPSIEGGIHDNFRILQLFWGLPIPETTGGQIDLDKPTVIIDHAGIALQRNYVEKNNELYGLCGIIGGAHYVHSHCTGIAMELYGAGYVMGPNGGLPPTVQERRIPLHEHYFRLYAGNNTVIVNGTSHGLDEGSWKGNANVWQNTVVNIAAEPKHLEDPVAVHFNFATQYLDDEVNNCDQERTLSTIRTSDSTGYFFDLFRSRSRDENKFHDFIYHNIGDETHFLDVNQNNLPLEQTDRYQTDIGDIVFSPGWRYFENTQTTKATEEALKIRFDVNYDKRYMHLLIPAGIERAYTQGLTPPTREARNGYVDKKTQVIAIRQNGEAWEKPFMAVFEPSINKTASVQHIEQLTDGQKVVGAKVTSKVGESTIIDYVIALDQSDAVYSNLDINLQFKGRFGIVRTTESNGTTSVSLYIGEGEELSFKGNRLIADSKDRAFKVF